MPNLPARIDRIDAGILEAEVRPLPRVTPGDLYDALLLDAGTENTRKARMFDVRIFARFLGVSPAEACALLIAGGRGRCNALLLAWREAERKRGRSNATINRSLATLRRAVKLALRLELVGWDCAVDPLPDTPYRDTRGPTMDDWRALWAAAERAGDSPRARRDRALVRLLRDLGLRRGEVIGIDYPEDVDLAGARIRIRGKGHGGSKTWMTLNPLCGELIRAWLRARGEAAGPLFTARNGGIGGRDEERYAGLRARVIELRADGFRPREVAEMLNREGSSTPTGLPWTPPRLFACLGVTDPKVMLERMSGKAVRDVVLTLACIAGVERPVRPHQIRHHSVTRVLDLTGGDVRTARKFARHSKVETTLLYDDAREDVAGDMVRRLGEDV